MITFSGVPASEGVGIGRAFVYAPPPPGSSDVEVEDPEREIARLSAAIAEVVQDLGERAAVTDGEVAMILTAQAAMASDPELLTLAAREIEQHRTTAEHAIAAACRHYGTALADGDDPLFAARAEDLRFIAASVQRILNDVETVDLDGVTEAVVLVASELAPADIMRLDRSFVKAIVTQEGSATSHMAIVARSLEIPAVVAVPGLLEAVDGHIVAVDGTRGRVHLDPDYATIAAAEQAASKRSFETLATRNVPGPAQTRDGHPIQMLANASSLADVESAVFAGAGGIGLLRTELLYLHRNDSPSYEEQADALSQMVRVLGDRPLVVRTFDFGADKAAPFLHAERTGNPALGVRGIRLSRIHEDMLDIQLRAIVTAAKEGSVAVMAPMITTIEDLHWFISKSEAAGAREASVDIGVTIEVPAAVLMADHIAQRSDFLSIGTNDLLQYVNAADREVGTLAHLQDIFSPALMRAIAAVCSQAGETPVAVCGNAAGDPGWALLAVGLGVTGLSMASPSLTSVKLALSRHDLDTCLEAGRAALSATSSLEVKKIADELVESAHARHY